MTEFKHFRVVLPNVVDPTGVGEGFIDSRRTRAFPTLPTSFALSQNKERAFIRWAAILDGLKVDSSPVSVTDIVETGGSVDSAPSQIDFTITYLAEQVVYLWDLADDPTAPVIYGPASVDPGSVITEALVIERIIANALARDNVDTPDIYDPTSSPLGQNIRVEDLTAGAFGDGGTVLLRRIDIEAEANFTVTAL